MKKHFWLLIALSLCVEPSYSVEKESIFSAIIKECKEKPLFIVFAGIAIYAAYSFINEFLHPPRCIHSDPRCKECEKKVLKEHKKIVKTSSKDKPSSSTNVIRDEKQTSPKTDSAAINCTIISTPKTDWVKVNQEADAFLEKHWDNFSPFA